MGDFRDRIQRLDDRLTKIENDIKDIQDTLNELLESEIITPDTVRKNEEKKMVTFDTQENKNGNEK